MRKDGKNERLKDMNNKQALGFFKDLAKRKDDAQSVKLGKSDFTALDAKFLLGGGGFDLLDKNSEVLELGAGTGLLLNKYASKVKSVVALEKFSDFSKFIQKADNVEIIHEDIVDFETPKEFDFVLIFGVMNYFNEEESKIIYQKCLKWLKKGGKLVVKNQFGVKEDVTIEEYSSEQEALYYSQYRFIDKEVANLAQMGFKNIKVVDIYPPECNRWDNTHFYAIVAEKL